MFFDFPNLATMSSITRFSFRSSDENVPPSL